MELIPEDLRMLRWGAVKPYEGRPEVKDVVAASPFESIRSAEIVSLFQRFFRVVELRRLGGTIQHLLYNGIVHNLLSIVGRPRLRPGHLEIEDAIIDSEMLTSDFRRLIACGAIRRSSPPVILCAAGGWV